MDSALPACLPAHPVLHSDLTKFLTPLRDCATMAVSVDTRRSSAGTTTYNKQGPRTNAEGELQGGVWGAAGEGQGDARGRRHRVVRAGRRGGPS